MTEYLNEIAILLLYVVVGIGVLLDRIRDARIKRLEERVELLEKMVNGILGAQGREMDRMLHRAFASKKEKKEDDQ